MQHLVLVLVGELTAVGKLSDFLEGQLIHNVMHLRSRVSKERKGRTGGARVR
jgi:hypothetical protein